MDWSTVRGQGGAWIERERERERERESEGGRDDGDRARGL